MQINILQCPEESELHVWSKHGITLREVEDSVYNQGFVRRGRSKNVYEVFGRTEAGRYLTVIVRYLGARTARLITARDMTRTERRRHDRHMAH